MWTRSQWSVTAVFLVVTRRPSGYVATSREPEIVAMGSSAVQAAENGVLAMQAILGRTSRLPTLILRVERPGRSTIVMQALDKPIRLDAAGANKSAL